MRITEDYEVLEAVAIAMDPALDGFAGVLVELAFDGERYALVETILGSGDRLFRFSSSSEELARAWFGSELGAGDRPAA